MIFTWIFIAAVAGMIFFFGFKMIKNISDTGEDVKVVKFFQNFEKNINEFYYLDSGSRGKETFYVPTSVEYICARKKSSASGTFIGITFDDKTKELIDNSQNFNVFLSPIKDSNLDTKSVDNMNVNHQSKCVKVVNGVVEINFKNNEGNVEIE